MGVSKQYPALVTVIFPQIPQIRRKGDVVSEARLGSRDPSVRRANIERNNCVQTDVRRIMKCHPVLRKGSISLRPQSILLHVWQNAGEPTQMRLGALSIFVCHAWRKGMVTSVVAM